MEIQESDKITDMIPFSFELEQHEKDKLKQLADHFKRSMTAELRFMIITKHKEVIGNVNNL